MKKLLSLFMAFSLMFSTVTIVSADNITANEFDEIYEIVWRADNFYQGLNDLYIQNRVYKELLPNYPYDRSATTVEIPKDVVESYLNKNYFVDDAFLEKYRNKWSYDEETGVYNVSTSTAGKGASPRPERHFLGCYKTEDGKYKLYFQHTTYQELSDEEVEKYKDKEGEMLYPRGEVPPYGYDRVISLDDYGLVHTVELNEGVVRFISTEEYSKEDLPESFNLYPTKAFSEYQMMMPAGFENKEIDNSSDASSEEQNESNKEISSESDDGEDKGIDNDNKPKNDTMVVVGLSIAFLSLTGVLIVLLKKKVNKD